MNDTLSSSAAVFTTDPLTRRVIADMAAAYGLPVTFTAAAREGAITISGPVRLGALLQKIRYQSLRTDRESRLLSLGRFVFDPDHMVLIAVESDDEVVLTEKEAAILTCLAETPGGLITRRDLLTRVWGYVDGVETHTLETHIYRLRQKLEIDPANPEILLTQEQGYSLEF